MPRTSPLSGNQVTPLPSVLDRATMIDHSLLHPAMTDSQLRAGLKIARDCACATACVEPYALPMWAEALAGFPHCNSHPDVIVAEGTRALSEGATEIDIVVNAGKGLGGDGDYGASELEQVNDAMTARDAIKVLFATKLTDVL